MEERQWRGEKREQGCEEESEKIGGERNRKQEKEKEEEEWKNRKIFVFAYA